jgi:hypothetical protein
MRTALVAVATVALFVACSSTSSSSDTSVTRTDATKPQIELIQVSEVPVAARHVTGGVPVQYVLRVGNRSSETIRLKSVTMNSVGTGAYNVAGSSTFKDKNIQPDQEQTVEFWMPAYIVNPTIMGANGPVTIRATVYFDAPSGGFQEVVVQQVNAMPGRDNTQ